MTAPFQRALCLIAIQQCTILLLAFIFDNYIKQKALQTERLFVW